MKTRQEIGYEVVEILRRRGFLAWWRGEIRFTIRYGQAWWLPSCGTCNWIEK